MTKNKEPAYGGFSDWEIFFRQAAIIFFFIVLVAVIAYFSFRKLN